MSAYCRCPSRPRPWLLVPAQTPPLRRAGAHDLRDIYEARSPLVPVWELTGTVTPRHGHGAVVIDGQIYVAGGMTKQSDSITDSVEKYNPVTKMTTTLAKMSLKRAHFGYAALGDMFYAVGGESNVILASAERYNPATDSWELIADLNQARRATCAAAAGGALYVFSGVGTDGTLKSVEMYNAASNSWSLVASLPEAIERPRATVYNDVLYVAHGHSYQQHSVELTTCAAAGLSDVPDEAGCREAHRLMAGTDFFLSQNPDDPRGCFTLGDGFYWNTISASGTTRTNRYSICVRDTNVYAYDTANGVIGNAGGGWTTLSALRQTASGGGLAALDGHVYAFGSEGSAQVIAATRIVAAVNFHPETTAKTMPASYLSDVGAPYPTYDDSGHRYGWSCDIKSDARERMEVNDPLVDTLIALDRESKCDDVYWQIDLPPGVYDVRVSIADPSFAWSSDACQIGPSHGPLEALVPVDVTARLGAASSDMTYFENTVTVFSSDDVDSTGVRLKGKWDSGCNGVNAVVISRSKIDSEWLTVTGMWQKQNGDVVRLTQSGSSVFNYAKRSADLNGDQLTWTGDGHPNGPLNLVATVLGKTLRWKEGGPVRISDGFCNRVDFFVPDLKTQYPNLRAKYQTSPSSEDDNGWYTHSPMGTGMCNIKSVDNCASICRAVSGCKFFSISLTSICYACFIYKSCPSPSADGHSAGPSYDVYRLPKEDNGVWTCTGGPCARAGLAGHAWDAGATGPIAPSCVRIVTGTGSSNDGTLNVYVDQGSGYQEATAGKTWSKGSTVLDECYAGLLGIRVTNPTNNAWTGKVEVATDGSYGALSCVDCTAGSSTAAIVVDGKADSGNQASTRCWNGKTCTLAVPSPRTGATGPVSFPEPLEGSSLVALTQPAFRLQERGIKKGPCRMTSRWIEAGGASSARRMKTFMGTEISGMRASGVPLHQAKVSCWARLDCVGFSNNPDDSTFYYSSLTGATLDTWTLFGIVNGEIGSHGSKISTGQLCSLAEAEEFGGWNNLGKCANLQECQSRCEAKAGCRFLVYRPTNKMCTAHRSCTLKSECCSDCGNNCANKRGLSRDEIWQLGGTSQSRSFRKDLSSCKSAPEHGYDGYGAAGVAGPVKKYEVDTELASSQLRLTVTASTGESALASDEFEALTAKCQDAQDLGLEFQTSLAGCMDRCRQTAGCIAVDALGPRSNVRCGLKTACGGVAGPCADTTLACGYRRALTMRGGTKPRLAIGEVRFFGDLAYEPSDECAADRSNARDHECLDAVAQAALKAPPYWPPAQSRVDRLTTGSWDHVPPGCSLDVRSNRAIYNYAQGTNNGRYRMACKAKLWGTCKQWAEDGCKLCNRCFSRGCPWMEDANRTFESFGSEKCHDGIIAEDCPLYQEESGRAVPAGPCTDEINGKCASFLQALWWGRGHGLPAVDPTAEAKPWAATTTFTITPEQLGTDTDGKVLVWFVSDSPDESPPVRSWGVGLSGGEGVPALIIDGQRVAFDWYKGEMRGPLNVADGKPHTVILHRADTAQSSIDLYLDGKYAGPGVGDFGLPKIASISRLMGLRDAQSNTVARKVGLCYGQRGCPHLSHAQDVPGLPCCS